MNINLHEIPEIKSIASQLRDWMEVSVYDVKNFIEVELLLYGLYAVDETAKAEGAWALLTGFTFHLPEDLHDNQRKIIKRLNALMPGEHGHANWNQRIQEYKSYGPDHRCFDIHHDGSFVKRDPQHVRNRFEQFDQLLSNPLPKGEAEAAFIRNGNYKYSVRDKDGHKVTKMAAFQNEQPNQDILLPRYRPKTRAKRPASLYQTPFANITHPKNEEEPQAIDYQGWNHLVGGLGVGKTQYIKEEAVRLVEEHLTGDDRFRTGIVTSDNSKVIEIYKDIKRLLKEKGLEEYVNVVPVMGMSSKETKVTNKYVQAQSTNVRHVTDWSEEDHETLRWTSGPCLVHAMTETYHEHSSYPCHSFHKSKKAESQPICPFADRCGPQRINAHLKEADIWITNAHTLNKTRISPVVDPYHRTVYEAMYDLLDLVFIDEVDDTQVILEESLIKEVSLFGEHNAIFESILRSVHEKRLDSREMQKNLDFEGSVHESERYVTKLYSILQEQKRMRDYFENRLVNVFHLREDLLSHVSKESHKDEISSEKLRDDLEEYVKNPFVEDKDGPLQQFAESLARTYRVVPLEELYEFLHQHYGFEIHSGDPKDERFFLRKFELFLYLRRLDKHLTRVWIKAERQYNHFPSDLIVGSFYLNATLQELLPFMPGSVTGLIFSYRYVRTESNDLGYFTTVGYYGIGRHLLHHWHDFFLDVSGREGPAIVGLSGTSYMPYSNHYHVPKEVNGVLRPRKQPGKIEQEALYLLDDDQSDGHYLKVSGSFKGKKRSRLTQMTQKLIPYLQKELEHWRHERKILLIVRSYEQAMIVKNALDQVSPSWERQSMVLTRDHVDQDGYIQTELLTQFPKQKNLLIAPLGPVSRGLNMVENDGEKAGQSLFGTVVFMVRPYPFPDDIVNYIIHLHGRLDDVLEKAYDQGDDLEGRITQMRYEGYKFLSKMIRNPEYLHTLDQKGKEQIALQIFTSIWQVTGRLLRGNTPARVIYADYAFNDIIQLWQRIFRRYQHDPIAKSLYGPFMDSAMELTNNEEKERPLYV